MFLIWRAEKEKKEEEKGEKSSDKCDEIFQ